MEKRMELPDLPAMAGGSEAIRRPITVTDS
jgi:hypothetical protein